MNCSKCDAQISEGSKFCPQCGQSQSDIEQLQQQCMVDINACEKAIHVGQGSRGYIRSNFHDRLSLWKEAAEMGVSHGQWLLARCYEEGFGIERSDIHALSWHLKAAEAGYAIAQNHVGSRYQNGDGVPEDETEAVLWFHRAADQGCVPAQANLGWCYDTGSGVAQDESEAVTWYAKAAEQGDSVSQFNLGVHYEWGSGVTQDKTGALNWYRKAAEQGYEKAAQESQRLTDELAESENDRQEQLRQTEHRFRQACQQALTDGALEAGEKRHLKALAETLEYSKEDRNRIFAEEKKLFDQKRTQDKARQVQSKFRIACKRALAEGAVEVDEKGQLTVLAQSLNIAKEDARRLFVEERQVFKASQQIQPTRSVELQFRKACKRVLADGKVTPEEESELKNLARFLRMSNEAMKQIFADEVKIFRQSRPEMLGRNVELQFRKACKRALADGKVTPEEERQLKSLAQFLKIPPQKMKQMFADEVKLYKQNRGEMTTTCS